MVEIVLVVAVILLVLIFMWFSDRQRSQNNLLVRDLVNSYIQIAGRPPVIVPTSNSETASVVKELGDAMGKIAYGLPQQPVKEASTPPTLHDAMVAGMNGQGGVVEGEWFPDVEFDEWMNQNDMPKRAGWLPPPTMRTEITDAYPDATTDTIPPGLRQAPRPNGDQRMFRAGESGPPPSTAQE